MSGILTILNGHTLSLSRLSYLSDTLIFSSGISCLTHVVSLSNNPSETWCIERNKLFHHDTTCLLDFVLLSPPQSTAHPLHNLNYKMRRILFNCHRQEHRWMFSRSRKDILPFSPQIKGYGDYLVFYTVDFNTRAWNIISQMFVNMNI
ncbi:hypothetical protein DMENIID0001_137040 [Sergentomyia squamirostris]